MHAVIPILDENACAGRQPLRIQLPRLSGPTAQLQALIDALTHEVTRPGAPLQPHEPLGGWLRELRCEPGLAEVQLAAELGCRGEMMAALIFDVLRARLPDTDIYVVVERQTQG